MNDLPSLSELCRGTWPEEGFSATEPFKIIKVYATELLILKKQLENKNEKTVRE